MATTATQVVLDTPAAEFRLPAILMAAMTTPAAELPTTLAEAHALILALAEERAAIEAELAKAGGRDKPQRAPRPRKEFGAHLERLEIVIEPEVPAGCEGLEKVLIGEDVSASVQHRRQRQPPQLP